MRGTLQSATALALVFGAYCFAPPGVARAQDADDGFQNLDEIVVTARMRDETILEAPISITAYTGEALEAEQIDSVADLAAVTPGLGFQQAASSTSSRPVIRGMSQLSRSSGDVANTGVFIDGIYSPGMSGVDMSFVGLERIEIVRGPQSAAYGRNTFAGAINYITRRPSFDPHYGLSAGVGDNDYASASAYITGGVIDDVLALRLDASITETGGTFVNQTNGETLNDSVSSTVRLGILLQPMHNLDIFGTITHYEDDASPSPLIVIADDSPRRVGRPAATSRSPVQIGRRVSGEINDYTETYYFDDASRNERESTRYGLIVDYDVAGLTITSHTGYEEREVSTLVDLDQTPSGTNFSGTFRQTASGDLEDRWEFSQDLRIQPATHGRFNWILGGYYSYERNQRADVRFADPQYNSSTYVVAPAPVNGEASIDEEFMIRNIFQSVYASADFAITDELTLTAEGRYTWERKRETVLQNNYGSNHGILGDYTTEFEYFTPRVILEYQPYDDINFYLSAAEGTKSGGSNSEAVGTSNPSDLTYDPETNWTYELGAKFRLFDNRLQVTSALYHVDWTDQQILIFASGISSATSITGNIGKSEIDGFEATATWTPFDWLQISGAYNYTDAHYVDATTSSFSGFVDCAALPDVECVGGVTTGRIDGNQLQFSPEHQASLGIQVVYPAFGAWEYYARTDVSTMSDYYVDAGQVGYIPGSTQVRLRFGLQSEHTAFMAFCNNLTDDQTPVTAFESRDFAGNPHYYVRAREGRMCGVSASAHF
jgi:iron complex outermembrane receptor protein